MVSADVGSTIRSLSMDLTFSVKSESDIFLTFLLTLFNQKLHRPKNSKSYSVKNSPITTVKK